MRKQTDAAFDRLLRSMEQVNSLQSRNGRNGNTIACLANNLLLIAVFMETIGFVSTLFCIGEQKSESNSDDMNEDEFERRRRALLPDMPDFTLAEVDEIEEDSSLVSKASERVVDIYNKETINSARNVSMNVKSNIYDLMDTTPKSMEGYL